MKDASKASLQKAIDSSCSLWEALKTIGVKTTTQHYYAVIRQRIITENLSVVQMQKNNEKRHPIHHKRLRLDDILCEGSKVNNQSLKKKLITAGLKDDVCEKCGVESRWQNEHLVQQIDHINGDSCDNRIDNCHSQTPTFAGKNQKKQKLRVKTYCCSDCGTSIHRGSQRCDKCARNARPKKLSVSRRDLHALVHVQKMPFTRIGKMYEVSDNAIRKRCRKLGIEVPMRKTTNT